MHQRDHELLAGVGPGTPMGQLLRRYWVPALLSEELPAPGGAPVRVRLLGEDLVAFRSPDGEVGLVSEFCAHRGASLFFGRNEEGGIRCSYHGWKYASCGTCLEMPNEPATSTFKDRVRQPAYPLKEVGGMIWAYLGPADTQPELPQLEYLTVPDSHQFVSKRYQACHWTQALEGDLDSSHVSFLHGSVLRERQDAGFATKTSTWILTDTAPHIEVVETPGGLMLGSRRLADEDSYYWRINHWLMPWYTFIPAFTGDGALAAHIWVPIDDTACWSYTFTWHPTRELTTAEVDGMRAGNANYADLLPNYHPRHNKSNGYNADGVGEDTDWPITRIRTIQEQDMAMTEGMGALYDRTEEHLASADVGLIQFRRQMLAAARSLEAGGEPPALDPAAFRVRQLSIVLPRETVNWPDVVADNINARPDTFVASA